MKFNTKEDFSGKNPQHRIINERFNLPDTPVGSIVLPVFGAFLSSTLKVRDGVSNVTLTNGKDYELIGFVGDATLMSGQGVNTGVRIIKPGVKSVVIDYYFVGGKFMTGQHLIQYISENWKVGDGVSYEWDNILGKPDFFAPKHHIQSIMDFYGYDLRIQEMDRMGINIERGITNNLATSLTPAENILAELEGALDADLDLNDTAWDTTKKRLRVQDGEYIFTDSKEDPAVSRGFGNWKLVNGIAVSGYGKGDEDNTPSTGIGALPFKQDGKAEADPLGDFETRLVNMWQNNGVNNNNKYILTIPRAGSSAGIINLAEDGEYVLQLQVTGAIIGQTYTVDLKDIPQSEIQFRGPPTITVDANGTGTLAFTVMKNSAPIEGTGLGRVGEIFLRGLAAPSAIKVRLAFRSKQKSIKAVISLNAGGTAPVERAPRGTEVFLVFETLGYVKGDRLYLNYSQSESDGMLINPTHSITIRRTNEKSWVHLKLSEDMAVGKSLQLVVYITEHPTELDSNDTYVTLDVMPKTDVHTASIKFLNPTTRKEIVSIYEGEEFLVSVETNTPNKELSIVYDSQRDLVRSFEGMETNITTDVNGRYEKKLKTIPDFQTQSEVHWLEATLGLKEPDFSPLDKTVLLINDTSKSLEVTTSYTKPNSTTPITKVNEGEVFWFRMKAKVWGANMTVFPTVTFIYGSDGDFDPNHMNTVRARVNHGFYPMLQFGPSSAAMSDVLWDDKGEMIFVMTAVANLEFSPKFIMSIGVKTAPEIPTVIKDIQVMDTSVTPVVPTWSSSPTQKRPITEISEMNNVGDNTEAWLWIEPQGRADLFGDIQLRLTGKAVNADVNTVFPQVIKFTDDKDRLKVVRVEFVSDWLTEGNEKFEVTGSYIDVNGKREDILIAPLTIIDSSITLNITAKASTSETDPNKAPAGGIFSEWYPFYIHYTFDPIGVPSVLEWDLSGDFRDQFVVRAKSKIPLASGATKYVVKLEPKQNFTVDGIKETTITLQRKTQAGKRMSKDHALKFKVNDDSIPKSVDLSYWLNKDSIGGAWTKFGNEGDEDSVIEIVVDKPHPNSMVVLETLNTSGDRIINGEYSLGEVGDVIKYPKKATVLAVVGSPPPATVTVVVPYGLMRNRLTIPSPATKQYFEVIGHILDNPNNLKVGATYTRVGEGDGMGTKMKIEVRDHSKTEVRKLEVLNKAGVVTTNIPEGEEFTVRLTITNPDYRDKYHLTGNKTYLDSDEFDVPKVAATTPTQASQVLTWKFKTKMDYNTNGARTILISAVNSNINVSTSVTVNITDVNKTPKGLIAITKAATPTVEHTGNIVEGEKYFVWVLFDAEYIDIDRTTCTLTSTLNPTRVEPAIHDQMGKEVKPAALAAGMFNPGGAYKFYIRHTLNTIKNYETDNTTFSMSFKNKLTSTVGNISRTFEDTTRAPSWSGVKWVNAAGTVVTSVDEGAEVFLVGMVSGIAGTTNRVKLDNSGGRLPAMMDVHPYGTTLSNVAENKEFKFRFVVGKNSGAETTESRRLQVKLTQIEANYPSGNYTLTINDTWRAAKGEIVMSGVTALPAPNTINEDQYFNMTFKITNLSKAGRYRVQLDGNRRTHPNSVNWKIDNEYTVTAAQFAADLIDVRINNRIVNGDELTNPAADNVITATIFDFQTNKTIATLPITIIDTSRKPWTTTQAKLVNPGTTTAATTIDEGKSFDQWLAKAAHDQVDWANGFTIRWEAVCSNYAVGDILNTTSGTITKANFNQTGTTFRLSMPVKADETTQTKGKPKVYINYFAVKAGYKIPLGKTNEIQINDTSPTPSLDDVYFSTNTNGTDRITNVKRAVPFFLIVKGKGLKADGGAVTVTLTKSGTAVNADLDPSTPIPANISCTMINSTSREYRGSRRFLTDYDAIGSFKEASVYFTNVRSSAFKEASTTHKYNIFNRLDTLDMVLEFKTLNPKHAANYKADTIALKCRSLESNGTNGVMSHAYWDRVFAMPTPRVSTNTTTGLVRYTWPMSYGNLETDNKAVLICAADVEFTLADKSKRLAKRVDIFGLTNELYVMFFKEPKANIQIYMSSGGGGGGGSFDHRDKPATNGSRGGWVELAYNQVPSTTSNWIYRTGGRRYVYITGGEGGLANPGAKPPTRGGKGGVISGHHATPSWFTKTYEEVAQGNDAKVPEENDTRGGINPRPESINFGGAGGNANGTPDMAGLRGAYAAGGGSGGSYVSHHTLNSSDTTLGVVLWYEGDQYGGQGGVGYNIPGNGNTGQNPLNRIYQNSPYFAGYTYNK